MKTQRGTDVSSTLSLTLALDGKGGGQRHAPAALYPGKSPGAPCTGDCVGPRAGMNRYGKSRPPPGFDQRVASLFTNHAVPAHTYKSDHSCEQQSCEAYVAARQSRHWRFA
jgi:hypothetical protein